MLPYVLIGAGVALLLWQRRFRAAAVCEVVPECRADAPVMGTIHLRRYGRGQTLARCDLTGLTPGLHGLHVHRCGDLSGGCATTCDHYNPDGRAHGPALGPHRHRGDFGNISAGEDGRSTTVVLADVTLDEIVGRAFVVHAGEDDLGQGGDEESTKTGNAGARIAGGLIRWTTDPLYSVE